jgi:uncharacterized protein
MKERLFPHVISLSDAKEQAWRNGGGTTRELLSRANPSSNDWNYRISVAEVNADGPFSFFERTRRHFCVLFGDGVDLNVDGVSHRVTKHANALSFSGEATVECRLIDGPTSDLNFMVRSNSDPKQLSGMLHLASGVPWALSGASSSGLFALQAGLCQWQIDGEFFELPLVPRQLAWFDSAPQQITFTATGSNPTATDPLPTNIAWAMFVC